MKWMSEMKQAGYYSFSLLVANYIDKKMKRLFHLFFVVIKV